MEKKKIFQNKNGYSIKDQKQIVSTLNFKDWDYEEDEDTNDKIKNDRIYGIRFFKAEKKEKKKKKKKEEEEEEKMEEEEEEEEEKEEEEEEKEEEEEEEKKDKNNNKIIDKNENYIYLRYLKRYPSSNFTFFSQE